MPGYSYTTLDDPSANRGTRAFGINDAGDIVGAYGTAAESSATTTAFLM